MRQGAQGWCTGMTLRDGMGREVGSGSGWGQHVHPWLIHVNVMQKPLQYCKVISLQLKLKKNKNNCCFLNCIQVSQEAGQVVCYSHLLKNFSQFIAVHTVKGFDIVNKAEVDVFLELSCFSYEPMDVGKLISGSSAFSKSSLNIWNFMVHILLKPGLENFEHYILSL